MVCKKDPLVVALTETWTTEFTNSKLFQIENYPEVILCNQKKRGGVGIYLKNNLEFEVLRCEISNATRLLPFSYLPLHLFAFTIVYKPPDTKDIFIETMKLHLDNLQRTKAIHHVVCGDFNINLFNTSFTASWLIEFMEKFEGKIVNPKDKEEFLLLQ